MDKKQAALNGIGFSGLLAIVFITLKLCGVINWSWWWVTCPLWGGIALGLAILLVIVIGAFAIAAWQTFRK